MRKVFAGAVRLGCDDALRWMGRFARSENGVLTVEWVALAACMAVGAVVLSFMVMSSLSGTAHCIGNQLNGVAC